MQLQGALRAPGLDNAVRDRMSRAVDEMDETIREIRQTIFALHEPSVRRQVSVAGSCARQHRRQPFLALSHPSVSPG